MVKSFILFFILVWTGLQGFSQLNMPVCGPYSKFYNKDSVNVVSFGASTVEGFGETRNFQSPLKAFLGNCYIGRTITVTNNGIAGETTSKGLLRFDQVIAQKTGFLLILMGANDAIQIADGAARLSTTLANMRLMIERARTAKLNVILGTLQYFTEIPGNSPAARLYQRRNRAIDQINNGYRSLAKELGIRIADINNVIGKNRQLYTDDVHPNARGYRIISLVWFDALNQDIIENYLSPGVVQNFPNPANSFTNLGFNLPSASRVKVSLYNLFGQRIAVVFDDYRNAGYHQEPISTELYAAGIYILSYEMLELRFSRKIVIAH